MPRSSAPETLAKKKKKQDIKAVFMKHKMKSGIVTKRGTYYILLKLEKKRTYNKEERK